MQCGMVTLSHTSETMPVNMDGEELLRDKSAMRHNDDNEEQTIVCEEETVEENDGDKSEEDSDLDTESVSNSEKEANRCL